MHLICFQYDSEDLLGRKAQVETLQLKVFLRFWRLHDSHELSARKIQLKTLQMKAFLRFWRLQDSHELSARKVRVETFQKKVRVIWIITKSCFLQKTHTQTTDKKSSDMEKIEKKCFLWKTFELLITSSIHEHECGKNELKAWALKQNKQTNNDVRSPRRTTQLHALMHLASK